VLLIHFLDDPVVDYEHSHVIYDALRKAKKSVELVTLKKKRKGEEEEEGRERKKRKKGGKAPDRRCPRCCGC